MSREHRKKLLNDFIKKPRREFEKQLKGLFDNGYVRVERKDWNDTFGIALDALDEVQTGQRGARQFFGYTITNKQWKDIKDHLKTNLKSTKIVLIDVVEDTNSLIKFAYKRGKKRRQGKTKHGEGIVNLENHMDRKVKTSMTGFFYTGDFDDLVDKAINSSEQTKEHGVVQEPDFHSPGDLQYPSAGGTGAVKGLRDRLRDGAATVPGAKGVTADKRMMAMIIESSKRQFSKQQWFTIFNETLRLKWADLFGYNSDVASKDTDIKVEDEMHMEILVLPTAYSDKMGTNEGYWDKAITNEIKAFLDDDDYFMSELIRLNPKNYLKAASITTGSKDTKQRIQDAAIKLAAVNVLEEIQDKYIRKDKITKVSRDSKKKRGISRASEKAKRGGTRKETRTKSSVPKRRGRPTKQRQAIGGNVLALKELINKMLPDVILQKMQSPALVNRTGRFRRSAEVTNAMIGPRGGVQIDYTYARDPYEVFEPGSGSPLANQYRDPRRIIGGSVREIAQSIMGKKFVRVRRV